MILAQNVCVCLSVKDTLLVGGHETPDKQAEADWQAEYA